MSKITHYKPATTLLHDITLAGVAVIASYYLRLGEDFYFAEPSLLPSMLVMMGIMGICLLAFQIHKRVWQFTALSDLFDLVKAITIAVLIFLPIMFLINRLEGVPRSFIPIDWLVTVLLLASPRIIYRIARNRSLSLKLGVIPARQKINIILAGVNETSDHFLREVIGKPNATYRVVGIIDGDEQKHGRMIHGIKVFGNYSVLERIIAKLQRKNQAPQKIIIAPDLLGGEDVQNLMNMAEENGLTISRLPRMTDFQTTEKLSLRPIALEDLLGRKQHALNKEAMKKLISGKKVLITGAGGSIGSEISRQIAALSPNSLIILDNCEYNLYQIEHYINNSDYNSELYAIIGDVKNPARLEQVFIKYQPEIVFHAAALKHVPLSEDNPEEAVLTNAIGTKNVADLCTRYKIKQMVMISTDKAVNPTNIMGASKRLAECYLLWLMGKKTNTKFITIRFGNVLGSSGSVIPLFQKQIAEGGPVTVTSPEIERFFMTIREATELVIQAASFYTDTTKNSGVYVLDMGKPILIREMAEQLIRLAGLTPHEDIKITYTGLRAGEKLYEELFYKSEKHHKTEHKAINMAQHVPIEINMEKLFSKIELAANEMDKKTLFSFIKQAVPAFESKTSIDEDNNSQENLTVMALQC